MKKISLVAAALLFILNLNCSDYDFRNPFDPDVVIDPPAVPSDPEPRDVSVDLLTDVTLSWQCSSPGNAPVKYDIYLDQQNPPKTKIASQQDKPSYKLTGLNNCRTYYWQIQASDNHGNVTLGPVWKFTTKGRPPRFPYMISPSDNIPGISTTFTFRWSRVDSAASYTLQISSDSLFRSFFLNQSKITDTLMTVSELGHSARFFWRVNAANDYGESGWPAAWSFMTAANNAPLEPANPTPSDNTIDQPRSLLLKWRCIDLENDPLRFDIYLDQNNPPKVKISALQTGTSYNVTGLSAGTAYYWQVYAKDDHGNMTGGPVWKFTVGSAPGIPSLTSPSDGALNVALKHTLSWNSPGATSYTLQVSAKKDFSDFIFNQSGLTSASKQMSGLNYSTVYYWRVNAVNNFGASDWSAVYSFTTVDNKPPVRPANPSPSDNAQDQQKTLTLCWTCSDPEGDPVTYDIYLDRQNPPAAKVSSKQSDAKFDITGLNLGTKYYWQVFAKDDHGNMTAGPVWSFTTGVLPQTPVLQSPADRSIDQSLSPTLCWNQTSDAQSYTLQAASDSLFTKLVFNQSGLGGTSRQITGLSYSTLYYWRVCAVNSIGSSSWSEIWNFKTKNNP